MDTAEVNETSIRTQWQGSGPTAGKHQGMPGQIHGKHLKNDWQSYKMKRKSWEKASEKQHKQLEPQENQEKLERNLGDVPI